MTTAAIGPETAVMDILTLVAIAADLRCAGRISARLVAAFTGEIGMRPLQPETGFLLVVELPQIPCVGRMAAAANLAQRPFMVVVGPVATDTLARSSDVLPLDMAALAGNNLVHAHQRERREVVIKATHRPPVVRYMAGSADFHFRIFMHVISRMTTGAIA